MGIISCLILKEGCQLVKGCGLPLLWMSETKKDVVKKLLPLTELISCYDLIFIEPNTG